MSQDKKLRLEFPQWQGGENPPYKFGAELLAWLAPKTRGPVVRVPVPDPDGSKLENENGIVGRTVLKQQLASAQTLIAEHAPDSIVTLGGDCLVSLAPFAWLSEKYGEKLGILWVDTHPDVMTPEQFEHAHAHVLGALMGNGDEDLTQAVSKPVSAAKIMIAGIHDPLPYEAAFLKEHGIATCSPAEVKAGADAVQQWMKREGIEYLAIHLDLDVLDPKSFHSVLFSYPDQKPGEFDGITQGKLEMSDVVNVIHLAGSAAQVVGLTVAEHLPWDAINLRAMLEKLPLLSD